MASARVCIAVVVLVVVALLSLLSQRTFAMSIFPTDDDKGDLFYKIDPSTHFGNPSVEVVCPRQFTIDVKPGTCVPTAKGVANINHAQSCARQLDRTPRVSGGCAREVALRLEGAEIGAPYTGPTQIKL